MAKNFYCDTAKNNGQAIWNVRNPTEVPGDIMVRIKSVLEALMECIEKIKISTMLPFIFAVSGTVCKILDNTHFQECGNALRECVDEMSKHAMPFLTMRNHIKLARVIDLFQNNHEVLNIIGHLFGNRVDVRPTVSAWNLIYELAAIRMYKDPKGELELERGLHSVYWENTEFNDFYKKFLIKTVKGRNKLQWRIAAKEAIVTQIENEFSLDRARRKCDLQSAEKSAGKQLHELQRLCQNKSREIEEELHKAKYSFSKAKRGNFRIEMDVRAERNKLMIQLQLLLRRYDSVMLEKKKMLISLNERLKAFQEDFEDFHKFYLKKEEIHNEIERKREEEFQARVEFFTQTRAAKIIQRAWKKFVKILRKRKAEEAKAKNKKKK